MIRHNDKGAQVNPLMLQRVREGGNKNLTPIPIQ
jgi:hypothetical protein